MNQSTIEPEVQPAELGGKPAFRGWTPTSSHLNPYVPPAFITLILVIGHLSFGILESYQKTMLAIVTSIICELLLGRLFLKRWPNLASAYITGISVGMPRPEATGISRAAPSTAEWPNVVLSQLIHSRTIGSTG